MLIKLIDDLNGKVIVVKMGIVMIDWIKVYLKLKEVC